MMCVCVCCVQQCKHVCMCALNTCVLCGHMYVSSCSVSVCRQVSACACACTCVYVYVHARALCVYVHARALVCTCMWDCTCYCTGCKCLYHDTKWRPALGLAVYSGSKPFLSILPDQYTDTLQITKLPTQIIAPPEAAVQGSPESAPSEHR